MRRSLTATVLALAVTGSAVVGLSGCSGDAAKTPTVASVDFTPRAVISATDAGPPTITVDDPGAGDQSLAVGSVVEVRNAGSDDHRITGTIDDASTLDTGTLHPDQSVTVVLADAGSLVLRIDDDDSRSLTITVTSVDG